jgi:hypothetical protein
MLSKEGSKFKVAAGCHPSLLDIEDAKVAKIPYCVLPSQDEDAEVSISLAPVVL